MTSILHFLLTFVFRNLDCDNYQKIENSHYFKICTFSLSLSIRKKHPASFLLINLISRRIFEVLLPFVPWQSTFTTAATAYTQHLVHTGRIIEKGDSYIRYVQCTYIGYILATYQQFMLHKSLRHRRNIVSHHLSFLSKDQPKQKRKLP